MICRVLKPEERIFSIVYQNKSCICVTAFTVAAGIYKTQKLLIAALTG